MKLVKQMNFVSPIIGLTGAAISTKLLLDATKNIQRTTHHAYRKLKKLHYKPYIPKYTWR